MEDKINVVQRTIEDLLLLTKRPGIEDLIEYLRNSDFYTAPASTQYHGSYEGGLAEHALNVCNGIDFLYENLKESDFKLPEISAESRKLVALTHDVCKVNSYIVDFRNQKIDGVWEKVPYYKRDPMLPMGHGGKSIFILQRFIELTVDEALAIFWHMGPYDISRYMTENELSKAFNENYLAYLLHTADMMSTYISENPRYQ